MMYTKNEQIEVANNVIALSKEVQPHDPIMAHAMTQAGESIHDLVEHITELEDVSQSLYYALSDMMVGLDNTHMYGELSRLLSRYDLVTNAVTFGSA